MCHIRKYVIFWYEKKKVEAFSFFFHIFIKKDGRRRDRDISIEIQMKLDILPFQKRSSPNHYYYYSKALPSQKRNVKKNQLLRYCCCPLWAKIRKGTTWGGQNHIVRLNIFLFFRTEKPWWWSEPAMHVEWRN